MHALVLTVALARPADAVCKHYAERVMRVAEGPLTVLQAREIVKANSVEATVCDDPEIKQATRLIVAKVGMQLLRDAEKTQPVHIHAGT